MAALTSLPSELLAEMVVYAGIGPDRTDSRSLACLARTCKLFYDICVPLLYNAVRCEDIFKFVRTLFHNPRLAAMVTELYVDDDAMPWGLEAPNIRKDGLNDMENNENDEEEIEDDVEEEIEEVNEEADDIEEEEGDEVEEDQEDDGEAYKDYDADWFQSGKPRHETIWRISTDDAKWLEASSERVLSKPCVLTPPLDAETEESMFCLLQTLACVYCPNLEKLRLPIAMEWEDLRELKDPGQILFPNLTCFSAQSFMEPFFAPIGKTLLSLLAKAPKLERCNLGGIRGLFSYLKTSSLRELHMNVSSIHMGEAEKIFSSLPNLESFLFDVHGADMGIIEERPGTLFNALQRYCKKVRRLRLTWNAELQDDEDGDGMEDEDMDDEGEGGNSGGGSRVIQAMGGMSSLRELTLYDGCTSICHVEGDATAVYKKFFPPHIEKISLIQSASNGPDGAPAFALATLAAIARTHYPQLKLVQVWSLEGTYNKDELEGLFRQAGIELQVFTYDYLTPDPSELFPSDIPSE